MNKAAKSLSPPFGRETEAIGAILHFKKVVLVALRQVAKGAHAAESLNMGLADLGTGGGQLVHGEELCVHLLDPAQLQRGGLTQTGHGDEGQAQALVIHDEEL